MYDGLDQRERRLLQMAINHARLIMHSYENLKLKADLYEMTRYAASVCPDQEEAAILNKQADEMRQLPVENDFDFATWAGGVVKKYENGN